jgi:hypothetical protein
MCDKTWQQNQVNEMALQLTFEKQEAQLSQ